MGRYVVVSEERARAYEPEGREICISITNPRAAPVELSPRFLAVLRLVFTDVCGPSPYAWDALFSPAHAREILDFVAAWPDVDRIVLHCKAGQSRSPAVALALCELCGAEVSELEAQFPLWNSWVRSELVRVARS
jgi:predicted protein tyrosine phosphatase